MYIFEEQNIHMKKLNTKEIPFCMYSVLCLRIICMAPSSSRAPCYRTNLSWFAPTVSSLYSSRFRWLHCTTWWSTTSLVIDSLSILNKKITNNGLVRRTQNLCAWPARYPDATIYDFVLWGYVKVIIFASTTHSPWWP